MSVSGNLPSSLLCDESGADCGWTDCALKLKSPITWIAGAFSGETFAEWQCGAESCVKCWFGGQTRDYKSMPFSTH